MMPIAVKSFNAQGGKSFYFIYDINLFCQFIRRQVLTDCYLFCMTITLLIQISCQTVSYSSYSSVVSLETCGVPTVPVVSSPQKFPWRPLGSQLYLW